MDLDTQPSNSSVLLAPSVDLQPYIKFYLWIERSPASQWSGLSRYPSNSGTCLAITLSGSTAEVAGSRKPSAYWFGTPLRPSEWVVDGAYSGVMIFFKAGIAHHLVTEPATDLVYADTDAGSLTARWPAELPERLQGLPQVDAIAAIENMLRRQLGAALRRKRALRGSIDIHAALWRHSPGAAAAEFGISLRHLERRCLRELGLTPKRLHRIFRFERLTGSPVMWNKAVSLAEVAVAACFFDQAHMIKEFRELTGVSPGTLRARVSAAHPDYWMYGAPRDLVFDRVQVHG